LSGAQLHGVSYFSCYIFILGTNFIIRPSLANEAALRCPIECEVGLGPDAPIFGVVFPNLLSLHLSSVQIFSFALFSNTLIVCSSHNVREVS
jgi:hypothetical protein